MLILNVLFAKLAYESDMDDLLNTKPIAMCESEHLFKALVCQDDCKSYQIACQRMVDDTESTIAYQKQGTITYHEMNCPKFSIFQCKKRISCEQDRIVTGVKCQGWDCHQFGVYCDKLSSPNGSPSIGKCFWTEEINKDTTFQKCPLGHVARGIDCTGRGCRRHHLECCELNQVNRNCQVGEYSDWSKCANHRQFATRQIIQQPIGDGSVCNELKKEQPCHECELSEWGSWSNCLNQQRFRRRQIIKAPIGKVDACGPLEQFETCKAPVKPPSKPPSKPPVKPIDCKVSSWSNWSQCTHHKQSRTRHITIKPTLNGKKCPILVEYRSCCNGYCFKKFT
eukprot:NODE_456_length_7225_cov_1.202498.p1 type:complete len:338 gc:universal NODE_456_length_7225_cov_1.202498:4943-3930(-)